MRSPVHVHVPGTTPVHVHVRSSRPPQDWTDQAEVKGGGPKVRSPWIPPGTSSSRRDVDSQRSRAQRQSGHRCGGQERREEDMDAVSNTLSILLREEEDVHRLKRSDSGVGRTDELLRTLVGAEIDGVAVANQLAALKEAVDGLVKDKRLSKPNAASVRRQRELLLEKMQMFDHTNQNLRELLRGWSQSERDSLAWAEQKDALKNRLSHCEAENMRLLAKLSTKDKEASQLAERLHFEKDNLKTTGEQWTILESTCVHLESQLNRAEAETVQMSAHIQRMQQNQEQKEEELRALEEELRAQRRDGSQEEARRRRHQEALALMSQRAERAEESTRELEGQLQDKETQLARALSTSRDWCLRHSEEETDRRKLEEDVSALRLNVDELKSRLGAAEDRGRQETETLCDQLHKLSADHASTELDNQRLQEEVDGLRSEARQLKASIKRSEELVEKHKKKVQRARLQAEASCLELDRKQKEVREVRASLEREKDQLLGRLRPLEALPDRLRRAELRLRDALREADAHERRAMEHSSALSEVRHKVEQQGSQLEMFQQRNLLLQEENKVLKEKIQDLERSLEDGREQSRDMSRALSAKDAGVQRIQQQLEDKTQECGALSRQLQQSLEDAQRQVDDSLHQVLAKETWSQSRSLDLQSQLGRAAAELGQLQRSKEEMERRFQSQLQNLKDRLEQSDATNRSLQSYVHFLKTSYGSVLTD